MHTNIIILKRHATIIIHVITWSQNHTITFLFHGASSPLGIQYNSYVYTPSLLQLEATAPLN